MWPRDDYVTWSIFGTHVFLSFQYSSWNAESVSITEISEDATDNPRSNILVARQSLVRSLCPLSQDSRVFLLQQRFFIKKKKRSRLLGFRLNIGNFLKLIRVVVSAGAIFDAIASLFSVSAVVGSRHCCCLIV